MQNRKTIIMKPKWIIETLKDVEDTNRLKEALTRANIEYKDVKYVPFSEEKYDIYPEEDCVVFYGSLNLAAQLRRKKKWVPGVYCNLDELKCTTYYSFLGKYLFNQDYIMLPLMELRRRKEEIYKQFGVDGCIFIRPNDGNKCMNGCVMPHDEFDREMSILYNYYNVPLDSILIIISSPKVITREWRYVVVDREIITFSQYKENWEIVRKNDENRVARQLVFDITREEWSPDKCYVLDIAESNGEIGLLELNSFSCSGLYSCDMDKIVKAVSEVAEKEWNEYYGI